jgi:hypothetical protein
MYVSQNGVSLGKCGCGCELGTGRCGRWRGVLGGWFWELHIPINLQGVQSSYASFFCVASVSEILGGWERVITEG